MKTLLSGGSVLMHDTGTLVQTSVLWEDSTILAVGEACATYRADRTLDATGLLVLPGLVDVHTHGRAGYDFSTADEAALATMKRDYVRNGVTTVLPTLASDTEEGWNAAIERIQKVGFDGIHLEGRYLNHTKRGAHPTHLLVPLDAEELDRILQKISIPCHLSAAFELDGDGSFAACACRHGATLGLGHTMATAEQARVAMSRGVTSFTHLFNAMPTLHHREGGAVCVALCEGGYGELIADGMHICPDMIALAYRCLGSERTVLITDSMEATGCADGTYSIAGQPVTVQNGRALTLDGALAGSTLDLWDGVKNLMCFAGIPLEQAILCATKNPARMVKLDRTVGSLEVGKRADIILVDEATLEIRQVICKGEPQTESKGETR